MSAEDFQRVAAATEAAKVEVDVPSDPDRKAPPVVGDGHRSNIGCHNPFRFDSGSTVFTVQAASTSDPIVYVQQMSATATDRTHW